ASAGRAPSATTAEPSLAHSVSGNLSFAEELFVAHHVLARMHFLPMSDIGLVVRHPDHQACRLGHHLTHQAQSGHSPTPATASPGPISIAVLRGLPRARRLAITP